MAFKVVICVVLLPCLRSKSAKPPNSLMERESRFCIEDSKFIAIWLMANYCWFLIPISMLKVGMLGSVNDFLVHSFKSYRCNCPWSQPTNIKFASIGLKQEYFMHAFSFGSDSIDLIGRFLILRFLLNSFSSELQYTYDLSYKHTLFFTCMLIRPEWLHLSMWLTELLPIPLTI